MSFVYEWTPSAVKPDNNSVVTIKTWDGEDVPGASITVSGFSVRIEVPRSNKYLVTIRSKHVKESAKLVIPSNDGSSNSIEDRLKNYTDKKIRETSGGSDVPGGLVIDHDNEGFFKIAQN